MNGAAGTDEGSNVHGRRSRRRGSRRELPLVIALSVILSGITGADTRGDEPTAFVGVHVIPLVGSDTLDDQTVLVREGRIVAVGPMDRVVPPEGTRVIEGRGKYLVPGLTDMHVHVATETAVEAGPRQLLLLLANGVTTILNAGDFGEPLNDWADEIRNGEMVGPTIYTAQYARGARDGNPTSVQVTSPDQARDYVRRSKLEGYSFIKVYNWTGPQEFAAIVDETRRQGMAVIGHVPQEVGLDDALRGGMAMLAHVGAGGLFRSHYQAWMEPSDYPRTARLVREAGVFVATTLAVEEVQAKVWGGSEQGWQEVLHQPGVRYAHPATIARWELKTKGQKIFSLDGREPGGRDAAVREMKRLTRLLHDENVNLLLGSDAPTVLLMAGFSIHRELAILQEIGIGAHDILTIASRNGGEFIHRHVPDAAPFGTIAPGMRADLLLLEADPLEDVGNLQKRTGVMARGRWYPEAELQQRLQDLTMRDGEDQAEGDEKE